MRKGFKKQDTVFIIDNGVKYWGEIVSVNGNKAEVRFGDTETIKVEIEELYHESESKGCAIYGGI